MGATRLGRIKIALDHHAHAAANDPVAVTPAKGGGHTRHTLGRDTLEDAHVEAHLLERGKGEREREKQQMSAACG